MATLPPELTNLICDFLSCDKSVRWRTTSMRDLKNLRLVNKQFAESVTRFVFQRTIVNAADPHCIDKLVQLSASPYAPLLQNLEIVYRPTLFREKHWEDPSVRVLKHWGFPTLLFQGLTEIGHYSSETTIQSDWERACGWVLVLILKQEGLPQLKTVYGLSYDILEVLGATLAKAVPIRLRNSLWRNVAKLQIAELSTLAPDPAYLEPRGRDEPARIQRGLSTFATFTSSELESLTLEHVRLELGQDGFVSFNGTLKRITLDFCRGREAGLLAALRPHRRSLESIDLHEFDLTNGTWARLYDIFRTNFRSLTKFRCVRGSYFIGEFSRDRNSGDGDRTALVRLQRQVLLNAKTKRAKQ